MKNGQLPCGRPKFKCVKIHCKKQTEATVMMKPIIRAREDIERAISEMAHPPVKGYTYVADNSGPHKYTDEEWQFMEDVVKDDRLLQY